MAKFAKATKKQAKGRIAITGPSGAGKTTTALIVARGLVGENGRIAGIDSEFGSMSKYADKFEFDVLDLEGKRHPSDYIAAIHAAEAEGYDCCIVDSITHAWEGTKDVVDKKKAASSAQNGFTAWAEGTKLWNDLQNAIMGSSMHIIVTVRAKTAYAQDKDEKGKTVIKKLGMAPELRDGTEYIFDAVLDMDLDHAVSISKTRCEELDGYFEVKPGENLGKILGAWLGSGEAVDMPLGRGQIDALVQNLKDAGLPKEEWNRVMGSAKVGEMERPQFAELSAWLRSSSAPANSTNRHASQPYQAD